MPGHVRLKIPANVARELRQEAGFGCARCGHPYIEYHHIVPWAQDHHFRPEDMMALCGNCHPAVSGFKLDRQREIKANPFNHNRGFARGHLEYDKRDLVFKIGGCYYEDVGVILRAFDTPLISAKLDEGQAKISLKLMDSRFRTHLVVKDNEIYFRTDDLWDFQYSHRFAVARHGPRDIAMSFDFREEIPTITGTMWIGNQSIKLGAEETNIPGWNLRGVHFSSVGTALQIGPDNVALPNGLLLRH